MQYMHYKDMYCVNKNVTQNNTHTTKIFTIKTKQLNHQYVIFTHVCHCCQLNEG